MQDSNTRKHAPGSVLELLVIALPMMASAACDTTMTFTDRFFLSKIGTAEMNAAMMGGMSCFMLTTLFIGLISYSTALVAQYYGAGQKNNCSVVVTQAAIIAVIAYPLILIASPLIRAMFHASGIAPEQLAPQMLFFNILIYATIIGLLRSALSSFFTGIGKTRIVMIASVTAMVVNIGMNYLLVFGKFGFPALGIRGSAYGTITGGVCGLFILVCAYFFGKQHSEFGVRNSYRFDPEIMKKLFKFGYPTGLEFFLNFGAFTGMVILFDACGQTVATAATITFNWDMVAFVPLIGIEIAVTSLVGRYMGARQPDIAHRSAISGIKIGSFYSGTMLVLFLLIPIALVNVFRPDVDSAVFNQALPLTVFMVRLVAVYVLSEAVMVALIGALRGAGDTLWAMYTSVGLHWLMVAILYIMLRVMHVSPKIAWVVMIIWIMLFSLVFYARYRGGKWRNIRMIHNPMEDQLQPHDALHEAAEA